MKCNQGIRLGNLIEDELGKNEKIKYLDRCQNPDLSKFLPHKEYSRYKSEDRSVGFLPATRCRLKSLPEGTNYW